MRYKYDAEFRAWNGYFTRKASDLESHREELEEVTTRIETATTEVESAKEAKEFLQSVAKEIQNQVHSRISSLVTRCLEIVMDDPYTFEIEFVEKRGKTEANLLFARNGEQFSPVHSTGGGAIDIASFALRLACLSLSKKKLERVLIMDEPFRFVSENLRPRVQQMLEMLSEDLGFQIIMVTHMNDLKFGNIVQIS